MMMMMTMTTTTKMMAVMMMTLELQFVKNQLLTCNRFCLLSRKFRKTCKLPNKPYFERIYNIYVFAYGKKRGCDKALLSLSEQWKKEIVDNKMIGFVSIERICRIKGF